MAYPTPNRTNDAYTPHSSGMFSNLSDEKQDKKKGAAQHHSPTMRQGADETRSDQVQRESVIDENHWRTLDELRRQAIARKKINDTKSAQAAMASSEPACRARESSPPILLPDPTDTSCFTCNRQQAGINPALFDKLGKLHRGEISHAQLNHPRPDLVQVIGTFLFGEWTALHFNAAKSPQGIQALLAAGGSLDAMAEGGITLLHFAMIRRDKNAVDHLLAAGAHPLACELNGYSPMTIALRYWPEIALTMARAIPFGAKANLDAEGNTELHAAIHHPEVLSAMLDAGIRDSANDMGMTALMQAAKAGELQSVRYLITHQPPADENSGAPSYLNLRSKHNGFTALVYACIRDEYEVVKLLIRHGARLYPLPDNKSLLRVAIYHRNIKILKILLANGAIDAEPDMPARLFKATRTAWAEGVGELGQHVRLDSRQQLKLMSNWLDEREGKTLAAISPLIASTTLNVRILTKSASLMKAPFSADSPALLLAMLNFFEDRDSFNYVIQAYACELIDDQGGSSRAEMARALLGFALPRISHLSKDENTVMRLIQLSDRLKDYTLVTEIKSRNASKKIFYKPEFSVKPEWISDPVSREFLGLKKSGETGKKIFDFLKTVTSKLIASDEADAIDAAQLSNDLIFALQSDVAGVELGKVFDAHPMSAIVSQALKPLLQGLITHLYPDPSTRTNAICRLLIGYSFSRLADAPQLTREPAFELIKSDPQWQKMRQRMASDIESLEEMAASILGTISSEQLGTSLPDVVAGLCIDAIGSASMETSLIASFRSKLGLLEAPARQLARACVEASQLWRASSTSSTTNSPDGTSTETDSMKALIRQEFIAQKRVASLPEEFIAVSIKLDPDLADDFNNLVWWQMDKLAVALGIDDSESERGNSSGVVSFSDDSLDRRENEKS